MICCKDCQDRLVTKDYNCHSHCDRYEREKKKNEEINQARIRYNQEVAYITQAVIKTKRACDYGRKIKMSR